MVMNEGPLPGNGCLDIQDGRRVGHVFRVRSCVDVSIMGWIRQSVDDLGPLCPSNVCLCSDACEPAVNHDQGGGPVVMATPQTRAAAV